MNDSSCVSVTSSPFPLYVTTFCAGSRWEHATYASYDLLSFVFSSIPRAQKDVLAAGQLIPHREPPVAGVSRVLVIEVFRCRPVRFAPPGSYRAVQTAVKWTHPLNSLLNIANGHEPLSIESMVQLFICLDVNSSLT